MNISFTNDAVHRQWAVPAPTKLSSTNLVQKNTDHKDSISISGQAHQLFNGMKDKSSSMIDSLMKQRESIIDMKNKLTERTNDSGKELSSIEEQLKQYNEQIAELDAQIAKQQTEERNKALGQGKEEQTAPEPKSEEGKLLMQATTLDQAKTLDQVSNKLDRQKRTLESEIKQDQSRGVNSERKQKMLTELEEKLETVQEQVQEKLKAQVDTDETKQEEEKETFELNDTENNQ